MSTGTKIAAACLLLLAAGANAKTGDGDFDACKSHQSFCAQQSLGQDPNHMMQTHPAAAGYSTPAGAAMMGEPMKQWHPTHDH